MARVSDDDPLAIGLRVKVGLRLKALREAVGKTQEEFVEATGARGNAYGKWERGEAFADPAVLFRLCAQYPVDFNYFYLGQLKGVSDGDIALRLSQELKRIDP